MSDFWTEILEFWDQHEAILSGISVVSAVMFVGTILIIPVIIARLPADYFINTHQHPDSSGLFVKILRNLLGTLLILLGIAMLVLPGQGLLTIAIGFLVMTFRFKHRLVAKVMANSGVRDATVWIRKKKGKEPFLFTDQGSNQEQEQDPSQGN